MDYSELKRRLKEREKAAKKVAAPPPPAGKPKDSGPSEDDLTPNVGPRILHYYIISSNLRP